MLNKAILMGRLVADPELKKTPSDTSVTSFSIAVDRNFADKNGQRQTDFLDIVAWRFTAEFICKYFQKGSLIAIEGTIQKRSYQDKEGNNRYVVEIVAEQAYFAESKKTGRSYADEIPPPPEFEEPAAKGSGFSIGNFEDLDIDSDEDLPF